MTVTATVTVHEAMGLAFVQPDVTPHRYVRRHLMETLPGLRHSTDMRDRCRPTSSIRYGDIQHRDRWAAGEMMLASTTLTTMRARSRIAAEYSVQKKSNEATRAA